MTTQVSRPAPSQHRIHPLLAQRWSPRAIDPKKAVSQEEIDSLLEAARWAPSAFNNQSWHYLVLTHEDALAKGRSTLTAGNAWAHAAPVLLFSVASLRFRTRDAAHPLGDYELGMASLSMALQATAMGLVFHQMLGFDRTKAEQLFDIDPKAYHVATAIAIGHPGEVEQLPPDRRELETAPRERITITEFSHFNRW